MERRYKLIKQIPTVEEYQTLREAVGWDRIADPKAADVGLNNSLFCVCAVSDNKVIGCGRVIGDMGIYYYVQDIIVLPKFQGKGLGKNIMDIIIDYLEEHASPGSFVGLMAAKGLSGFYERYGFTKRPSDGPGMFRMM
ncbi:GNAT family N-acetyltransferase [Methanococcoides orientis]|uniref:GNAT family N-acetyltransferase n=1 Tax=Methanococcoides orientis TaxID=2822137 RepID=UPI001E501638|nr:GNAT family N-acetyltransferase [Methanococcoides orientis]UGV41730.1 GNAT family N-acetyltransferase [Methanococcoides orientis]